jgi:hypothetical protein
MCDKLVYDLAQEVEGSPCVFIRKDWINILDNQNQSYVSNQSVLDTSQLSNSNKWMSYREAYFSVPLTITMATQTPVSQNINAAAGSVTNAPSFTPLTAGSSADQAIGLKNWYGNIIHSFTLDYNGTTIIQQTPFVNMWNSFKLMTSLSYQDVITQGCTIGFYPDSPETWEFYQATGSNGLAATSRIATPVVAAGGNQIIPGTGLCNNTNLRSFTTALPTSFTHFQSGLGNKGFVERCKWISFDVQGIAGQTASATPYGGLLSGGSGTLTDSSGAQALTNLWKGYIFKKTNQVGTYLAQTTPGMIQYAVVATIYLKHIHSFFNMIPLLKGVFMKMTMNLNNCSSTVYIGASQESAGAGTTSGASTAFSACQGVQSALGGANMLMLASIAAGQGAASLAPVLNGGAGAIALTCNAAATTTVWAQSFRMNLSVGATCLDSVITNQPGQTVGASPLSKSIYLYIPAYTFNPTFEQAYLSSPVKQIKYTDIYQYQVLNVAQNAQINNLLTNGIANVKSVLILPFYSTQGANPPESFDSLCGISLSSNSGFTAGQPVWASPFDPAGCGATSPLCHLTNFNIQVSGQNAIYNLQKYVFEQFNNQLYGQNAVNGGLTDGITSSLIDRQAFDLEYCYYYVNVERMLPVEQSVPKSIQLVGTNQSSKALDLLCFIEYGTEVSIDALTGARV